MNLMMKYPWLYTTYTPIVPNGLWLGVSKLNKVLTYSRLPTQSL